MGLKFISRFFSHKKKALLRDEELSVEAAVRVLSGLVCLYGIQGLDWIYCNPWQLKIQLN